jgi:urease accessory protein
MSEDAFVSALQLADSALPIGRFTHSSGLEALLTAEPDLGAEGLLEVVETALVESVGPLDGVAVAEAYRAASRGELDALVSLDRLVTARKLSPGSRLASTSCGRRLAVLIRNLTEREPAVSFASLVRDGRSDGNLAVVEGALASALGIELRQIVLIELRGTAAALLSAAVRLGRLSALSAQALLRRLEPALIETADDAVERPSSELRSTALELEIFALTHRRENVRLFAS